MATSAPPKSVDYEPKSNWTRQEILETTRALGVRFMRLQFTDILGVNKNVEVPFRQFEKALDGEIAFDKIQSQIRH